MFASLVQFGTEEERETVLVHIHIFKKICTVMLSNFESRKERQDWLM